MTRPTTEWRKLSRIEVYERMSRTVRSYLMIGVEGYRMAAYLLYGAFNCIDARIVPSAGCLTADEGILLTYPNIARPKPPRI